MIKYVFIIFALLAFFGCESKVEKYEYKDVNISLTPSSKKEALLVQRFAQYWHKRLNGDYNSSYDFELPSQRYLVSLKEYKNVLGLYKGSKADLVHISYPHPDIAIVTRKMRIKNKAFTRLDKWLFIDDNWYHKFYQTALPPIGEEEKFQ